MRTWEGNIEVYLIKIGRFEVKNINLEWKAAVTSNKLGFYKMRGITFLGWRATQNDNLRNGIIYLVTISVS
jgi:hypothetical protein